jgi:hypothetical protein
MCAYCLLTQNIHALNQNSLGTNGPLRSRTTGRTITLLWQAAVDEQH